MDYFWPTPFNHLLLMGCFIFSKWSECEDGWKQHGANCYLATEDKKPFNESVLQCRAMSAQLVEIGDADENEFVHNLT